MSKKSLTPHGLLAQAIRDRQMGDSSGKAAPAPRFRLWLASMSSVNRSLESRRAERELFFWTARQTLKLVTWTAVTIYFLVSLIHGEPAGMRELLDFTSQIVALFR